MKADSYRHLVLNQAEEEEKMTGYSKIYAVLIVFLLSFTLGTISFAEEAEKPTCDAGLTFYFQDIRRAQESSNNRLVKFPEITASYKGFGFTLWGDFATRDDEEMFVVRGYDTFLSPEVSVWRGIEWGTSRHINLSLSHNFEFESGHSLDLGANAGWRHNPCGDHGNQAWHGFNISADYSIPVSDRCTVSPSINYTTALAGEAEAWMEEIIFDGDDSDFFYGGVTLAVSF